MNETDVTVYYGPLTWFKAELDGLDVESLLELASLYDQSNRRIIHTVAGSSAGDDELAEEVGAEHVAAESSDYASFSEHTISNFVGLIRLLRLDHLYLHNPPARILAQLERAFTTEIKRYTYAPVTSETLRAVNNGFAEHLIGQHEVKERLLAALYPLTAENRTKPMVLMFYGPSGVGKTETAMFVNGLLDGTLMRKQFSMFHSEKFASYIFGGTHAEASFAQDLLDRDSGVILIDEFDKANSIFHSAFYQLFDGGEFEDKNYVVDVGPALIICTSNYASVNEIQEALGDALYSRFDSVIQFKPLSPDEIVQLIDRLVDAKIEALSSRDQSLLDPRTIKESLYPQSKAFGNVRSLGKLVDEIISISLVRMLLTEDSATPPQ
jgi:ATP-dependent Clp protease ATP-binding subunit ClpA